MKSKSLLGQRLGNIFFFFCSNADSREKEDYVLQIKSLTYKDIMM